MRTDPNLKPFFARGGKLVIYHGWSDAAITPIGTIDYYNKVLATTGKDAPVKLYMVPGMDHCAGGPGGGQLRPVRMAAELRPG